MKVINYLVIAATEIKKEKWLFICFEIVCALLFSISAAVMDTALYLPERISEVMRRNSLDRISIFEIAQVTDLKDLFSDENISIDILDCEASVYIQNENKPVFGGVLFADELTDMQRTRILDRLQSNESEAFLKDIDGILLSDTEASNRSLGVGDAIMIKPTYECKPITAHIKGIYTGTDDLFPYYISGKVYDQLFNIDNTTSLTVEFAASNLRDILRVKPILEKSGLFFQLSDDVLQIIRMLYITLYSVNIVFLIALSGAVFNFIDMYLQRRQKFYAVQSAIGMSERNIIILLFLISEFIILIMFVFSLALSAWALQYIKQYASAVLTLPSGKFYIPILPLVINLLIIQVCMGLLMFRFRCNLHRFDTVRLLHEE